MLWTIASKFGEYPAYSIWEKMIASDKGGVPSRSSRTTSALRLYSNIEKMYVATDFPSTSSV